MAVRGYKDATRGIIPDYPMKHTITDLLHDGLLGGDKEMSLALKLARAEH
jgi:hypothetical protein